MRLYALALTILLTGCDSFIGTINVHLPDPFKSDPALAGAPEPDPAGPDAGAECPEWMDLPPDAREYLGAAASRPPGLNEWLSYLRDTVRPFLDGGCRGPDVSN